ncbi:MAG TPA: hypothetical protein VJ739_13850, partial [Gemmataceae bacterium]|nr:hypothetical protein [Gemmataceae bacterium]
DDQIFRLHLRLTMTGEDKGTLESWVTDEDFLESLARANRVVRTPEQARISKFILEQDQKHLREPKMMGTFLRRDSEY